MAAGVLNTRIPDGSSTKPLNSDNGSTELWCEELLPVSSDVAAVVLNTSKIPDGSSTEQLISDNDSTNPLNLDGKSNSTSVKAKDSEIYSHFDEGCTSDIYDTVETSRPWSARGITCTRRYLRRQYAIYRLSIQPEIHRRCFHCLKTHADKVKLVEMANHQLACTECARISQRQETLSEVQPTVTQDEDGTPRPETRKSKRLKGPRKSRVHFDELTTATLPEMRAKPPPSVTRQLTTMGYVDGHPASSMTQDVEWMTNLQPKRLRTKAHSVRAQGISHKFWHKWLRSAPPLPRDNEDFARSEHEYHIARCNLAVVDAILGQVLYRDADLLASGLKLTVENGINEQTYPIEFEAAHWRKVCVVILTSGTITRPKLISSVIMGKRLMPPRHSETCRLALPEDYINPDEDPADCARRIALQQCGVSIPLVEWKNVYDVRRRRGHGDYQVEIWWGHENGPSIAVVEDPMVFTEVMIMNIKQSLRPTQARTLRLDAVNIDLLAQFYDHFMVKRSALAEYQSNKSGYAPFTLHAEVWKILKGWQQSEMYPIILGKLNRLISELTVQTQVLQIEGISGITKSTYITNRRDKVNLPESKSTPTR
jgi:ADP-ribose pyrophosphatase YjhB (NUDIX family)